MTIYCNSCGERFGVERSSVCSRGRCDACGEIGMCSHVPFADVLDAVERKREGELRSALKELMAAMEALSFALRSSVNLEAAAERAIGAMYNVLTGGDKRSLETLLFTWREDGDEGRDESGEEERDRR